MADALGNGGRSAALLRPGTVLADRYRIEAILGAGAFGVVWRARHVHLETECALKLFHPPLDADPEEAAARFLQEARVMARLKCPYVAQVFDYGVHDAMPFLVLELLPGKSLAGHLEARREQGLRLSPAETAHVIRNVAEALHVAHAARVVHRDLKPANIVLVPEGESYVAKVLDFGIAKWSTEAAPSMTTTRTVMGTPHYMSPEQFESARQVDHRADLWSLGVIAFECLTGQVPFPGDSFIDVAFKVCKEGPLVASQLGPVPAGFDAWFARATAQGREHRFASALEQAQALEQLCSAAPAHPEPSAARPLTASVRHAATHTVASARAAHGNGGAMVVRGLLGLGTACLLALSAWLWLFSENSDTGVVEQTLSAQPPSPASEPGAAPGATLPHPASPGGPESAPAISPPAPSDSANSEPSPEAQRPSPEPRVSAAEQHAGTPPGTPLANSPRSTVRAPAASVPAQSAPKAATQKAADAPAAPSTDILADPVTPPTDSAPRAGNTFNRVAAKAALDAAALQASNCRPPGGPLGPGRVQVRYDPSGQVVSVAMLTSKFDNTAAGACVRMLFRRAKVPAFTGAPVVMVTKAFEIPSGTPERQPLDTSTGAPAAKRKECDPPWFVDDKGIQRLKPSCL